MSFSNRLILETKTIICPIVQCLICAVAVFEKTLNVKSCNMDQRINNIFNIPEILIGLEF